jgi:hypothetical protein
MRYVFFFISFFVSTTFSQQSKQSVKQDSSLFDFWIGDWDLTWNDPDGSAATGTNIITKILDGKVIMENFTGLTGQSKGYKGQSVSILDNRTGVWKQTWVDNQSAYLPFTGGAEGKNRFFEQEFMNNGKLQRGKMIFRDITRDKFVWDWMQSTDSGKTWTTQWSIRYIRKK